MKRKFYVLDVLLAILAFAALIGVLHYAHLWISWFVRHWRYPGL